MSLGAVVTLCCEATRDLPVSINEMPVATKSGVAKAPSARAAFLATKKAGTVKGKAHIDDKAAAAPRDASPVDVKTAETARELSNPTVTPSSNNGAQDGKAADHDGEDQPFDVGVARLRLPQQQHHVAMLESMDRKARELCDDTRRQYELLLTRIEAQHERQLQTLQHKLKEAVSTSIPLSEHRQLLSDLSRSHERDTRALVRAHDEETAALRVRYKQIANEQLLLRSRSFQDEKDQLMETMAQLEMDRNAALRQWREEELAVLNAQKEAQEARQAHELTQLKLQEACQHIVTLKAQLSKLDRMAKKRQDERVAHAAALNALQQQLTAASAAVHEQSVRVSVLETELAHERRTSKTSQDELTNLKTGLAARDAQVSELQRALAETAAKETLLGEFRDTERAAYEQQQTAWRAALAKLEGHEADARRQIAALQQEKQALEAACQRLTHDAAQAASASETREAALRDKLQSARLKYAAVKQRVAQLETAHAELQDEERVNQLLFASAGSRR